MKKTQKKVFGLTGLALVAAMTTYAAILPAPEASATQNITDTIQVRVVGSVPEVNFTYPTGNVTVSNPNQELKISHENVKTATISLNYTDNNGTEYKIEDYKTLDLDYAAGESTIQTNLSDYGYGIFEFTVSAFGNDGVPDTDAIVITYIPVQGAVEDQDDGSVKVDLDYDKDKIDHIDISVYPEGGDESLYDTTVTPPADSVILPFDEFAPETGYYEIVISSYDKEGNLLYTTTILYYYEVVPVPDTGALFTKLNIAKEDYLATGLIIFFILAIVAFGVVAKGRKTKNSK